MAGATAEERTARIDNSRQPDPLPPAGTAVWYALKLGPLVEYREAKVVNVGVEGKTLEEADYDDGRLHLAVSLVKSRHHAAKDVGYRYNAPWGAGASHWLLHKPETADADFAKAKERLALKEDIQREQMHSADVKGV